MIPPARRGPGGQRMYDETDVARVLGLPSSPSRRRTVVYARVSGRKQADDLAGQAAALEQFTQARGLAVDEWVEEYGFGLNFKRRKFLKLVTAMTRGEAAEVVVAHRDRLCRFGFDLLERLAAENNCTITVMNQPSLSPQEEMAEDLLSIIHVFSCRFYGLRKYKTQLAEAVKQ